MALSFFSGNKKVERENAEIGNGKNNSPKSKQVKLSKSTSQTKTKKVDGNPKESKVQGPFKITFYGNEVRRFYLDGEWLLPIDDVMSIVVKTPQDEKPRGNKDQLNNLLKKETIIITYKTVSGTDDNLECVTPTIARELIMYVDGSIPGPFPDWLLELNNFQLEAVIPPKVPTEPKAPLAVNPSETGR